MMNEDIEETETDNLEKKHKKEKKELQAQIQALKKAAKNDKTKKKELATEIVRLESELEERHKIEKESIHTNSEENDITEETNDNIIKNKVSKAQKRRDKKTLLEKERNEQIKLQEKENSKGPRNLEMQAICARLKERNLAVFSIPSDGDCLYKAIAHQLQVKHKKTLSVDELRNNVASYIQDNKDDFLPFLSNPETFEMLTDVEFTEYCNKIKTSKVWGGQLEIRALSNLLKCPITVIQATGPEAIEQGADFTSPALILSYHRHMFSLGEHYNSTQTVLENDLPPF